jgi:hypothetical protein
MIRIMATKFPRVLLFLLPVLAFAETDPAALQKQVQDLEKRQRREEQKIDQAEEQEKIKLRTRERDELARVQRDVTAAVTTATAGAVATGSMGAYDPAKFAQLQFAQDEVHNLIQNQLGPEIAARFNRDRKALARKYALERAKLEAPPAEGGDDAPKQHDLALKTAELNDKFQEKYDDLELEQSAEEAKVRFNHTTTLNTAGRDLAAMVAKHTLEQVAKGNAAAWNPAADPDYGKLTAAHDQAQGELETALDEVRAKFTSRRTDIDNAKEDELGKLNGG